MTSGVADCRRFQGRAGSTPRRQKAIALFQSIEWQEGPGTGKLGTIAEIKIPEGYRFTGQDGARKWAELNENIPSNADMGVLMPKANGGWFIVFTYEDSGHIADDEKGELDAAAILESLRQGNDAANEERRQRGWAPLDLVGWQAATGLRGHDAPSHLGPPRPQRGPGEHQLQHEDPGPDRRHVGHPRGRPRRSSTAPSLPPSSFWPATSSRPAASMRNGGPATRLPSTA